MNKIILIIGFALALTSITEKNSAPHPAPFNIEDYSWLVGSWTGDGFGGVSHETWAEPVNGTMMGMYRHINAGCFMPKPGCSLNIPDLTGWEEKDDMTTFEMISYSKDKIEMKGLVLEKKSDTEMVISLKMTRNGESHTEVFNMKRD